ncbi:MAG: hypothetical protein ABJA67_06400, partial [Chthonomonadales bacterium]
MMILCVTGFVHNHIQQRLRSGNSFNLKQTIFENFSLTAFWVVVIVPTICDTSNINKPVAMGWSFIVPPAYLAIVTLLAKIRPRKETYKALNRSEIKRNPVAFLVGKHSASDAQVGDLVRTLSNIHYTVRQETLAELIR